MYGCLVSGFLVSGFPKTTSSRFRKATVASRVASLSVLIMTDFVPDTTNASSSRYCSVDLLSYLQDVEDEVRSYSSDSSFLRVQISDNHRKCMIRTLLGYTASRKLEFDQIVRDLRHELSFRRIAQFMTEQLSPVISTNRTSIPTDFMQKFNSGLENALSVRNVLVLPATIFSRVASGPIYQGNVVAMLRDVAPDLIPSYEHAIKPVTDTEVLERLINDDNVSAELKEAARRCLYMNLPKAGDLVVDSDAGIEPSEDCEKKLIEFLTYHRRRVADDIVLHNVRVRKMDAETQSFMQRRRQWNSTGYIFTSVGRYKLCSEFDGVIVRRQQGKRGIHPLTLTETERTLHQSRDSMPNDNEGHDQRFVVTEVWDSKLTIHPASIHDVVNRKLLAFQSLVDDEHSVLVHQGGTAEFTGDHTDLYFGIFGTEIFSPQRAVAQLKCICSQQALGTDIPLVLQAIEHGNIQLDGDTIIQKILDVKEALHKLGAQHMSLIIHECDPDNLS